MHVPLNNETAKNANIFKIGIDATTKILQHNKVFKILFIKITSFC